MRAKKSLGQNFLQDKTITNRIVDGLGLRENESVVEIGPGHGALTEQLLARGARVIAVEFDRDLIPILKDKFSRYENFSIVNEDALKVDFSELISNNLKSEIGDLKFEIRDLKLVANLPYNISTPILQRLIDQRHRFSNLVLMFQREVVERITAKPGGKERGFLSVLVENVFETEYLFDVPPQAFQPVPKVWSAVVRLTPKRSDVADEAALRKIVSVSFAQKRKNILNNLKTAFAGAPALLEVSDIDGKRRAETLTIEEWQRLTDTIAQTKMTGQPDRQTRSKV
jgi:16S rRNA (adenine1518-N6/adenine1519-N6)-dimethyltransferase